MPALSPNPSAVTINFDKPRDFRFTWSAVNRFEEAYGKSLPKAFLDDIGPRLLTHMARVGLLHAEPRLTVEDVEKRFDRFLANGGDITVLSNDLTKAMLVSGVLGKREAIARAIEQAEAEAAGRDDENVEGNDQGSES